MNGSKYCYNAFVGRMILSSAQTTSIAVCYGTLIPFTIACNAALVFALYKTKQFKVVANWNVVILSISDCLIGLVSAPMVVILFGKFGNKRICWFELATLLVGQTNTHFSGYMMMIIAIQRYVKVTPRFSQSIIAEKMTTKTGLIVIVCINLITSLMHGVVTTYFFTLSTSKIPNVIMMAINCILVAIVYACYIRLFCGIKRHATSTAVLWENGTNHINSQNITPVNISQGAKTYKNSQKTKRPNANHGYKEFTKTMTFVLVSFAVCSIPYVLLDFWTGWYSFVKQQEAPQIIRYLYNLSLTLINLNCIINALILLYRNKKAANYIRQHLSSTVATTEVQ